MTDTATTPPPWYAVLQALTPSLNQVVIGVGGALVGIVTALGAQWVTAAPQPPPAPPTAEVQKVQTTKIIVDPVLIDIIRDIGGELGGLRRDMVDSIKAMSGRLDALEAAIADLRNSKSAPRRSAKTTKAQPPKSGP